MHTLGYGHVTISRLCFPYLAHKTKTNPDMCSLGDAVVQVCCLPLHEPHQSRRCARHHINSVNELVGSLHTHIHRMVKIRPDFDFVEMRWSNSNHLSLPKGQRWRHKRAGNVTRTEGQSCNEYITNCMYGTHPPQFLHHCKHNST